MPNKKNFLFKTLGFSFLSIFIFLCLNSCESSSLHQRSVNITNLVVISDDVNLLTARISFQTNTTEGIALEILPANESESINEPTIKQRFTGNQLKFDILGLEGNSVYRFKILDTFNDNEIISEGTFKTEHIPDWMTSFLPEVNAGIQIDGKLLLENRSLPAAAYIVDPVTGSLFMARHTPERIAVIKATNRNTLLSMLCDGQSYRDCNKITETTVAGDTLLYLEKGRNGFDKYLHHDLLMTEAGNIVAIYSEEIDGLTVDGLIKLDRQGNKIWEWDTSDIIEPSYETYTQPWANSVFKDHEGNFIISFRRISQVWKLNRSSRSVEWRLGIDRLIEPTISIESNDAFLMQHYAHLIDSNKLVLLDNGQDREEFGFDDFRPTSRISIFNFNDLENIIESVKHIDLPEKYFTRVMGSVIRLENSFIVGSSVPGYVVHISDNGEILGELKFGDRFYRAEMIYIE